MLDLGGVKAVGRLVQKQDVRIVQQGLSDSDPLTITARQGADDDLGFFGQIGALDSCADCPRPLRKETSSTARKSPYLRPMRATLIIIILSQSEVTGL
jgi:hypothetical protein